MKKSNIEGYEDTRVYLSRNGELFIALPVYSNQNGAILDEKDVNKLIGLKVSVGFYDHVGYIGFHPEYGEFVMSRDLNNLCQDLGKL
jgi:hypothetical protein